MQKKIKSAPQKK